MALLAKKKTTGVKEIIAKPANVFVKSEARYLKISPRKLRLVAEAVKKLPPVEAMSRLKIWNKKASRLLLKAVKTVVADATHNYGLKKEGLSFKEILVNEGPRLKRIDYSHGARFNGGMIQKRMAHLRIIVTGKNEGKNGTKD